MEPQTPVVETAFEGPRTEAASAALRALPLGALVATSVLFRLPALLNAASTHSDAAVVGLQAMHILRGEWSWFLYGSGYQTSVDSFVAALYFAVLGPTPFALRLSSFVGHLLLTSFVYAVLRRRLPPWSAVLLALPLVFAPGPLHTYVLYPPRQTALTLVFASFWLLDGAPSSRRPGGRKTARGPVLSARGPLFRYGSGAALAGLACFADPYAMLFLPAAALFALLVSFEATGVAGWRPRARAAAACALGALVGMVPKLLLTLSPRASLGTQTLTAAVLEHNARLLWDPCLPYVLSYGVHYAQRGLEYEPWRVPAWFHAVQIVGAVVLVGGMLSGAVLGFAKGVPREVRRLGVTGALMLPVTLGAFLLSPMVMDLFSARYLAAIVLAAPFALAPLLHRLGARRLALGLSIYLASAAVAGWLNYSPSVDGPRIRLEPGRASEEHALHDVLVARGIRHATADYWTSYRLTFLWRESVIVVPTNPDEDRYAPYRRAFEADPIVAYVYDPLRSREDLSKARAELERPDSPFAPDIERLDVGRLTVLFLYRKPRAL